MASKRTATTELNHENWEAEEEPEEAGTFALAPDDVLEKRTVRRAKRRLAGSSTEGAAKSAFGSFAGFKMLPPSMSATAFSFLKSNSTSTDNTSKPSTLFSNLSSNGTTTTTTKPAEQNGTLTFHKTTEKSNDEPEKKKDTIFKQSSDYFAKLKGLNESVAQWIKTHVDSNPFCILTPIFRDYEKYLKEIEAKRDEEKEESKQVEPSPKETPKPTLMFGSGSNDSSEKKVESIFTNKTPASSPSIVFGTSAPSKSIFGTSDGKNMFGNDANPFLNKSKGTPEKSEEKKEEKKEEKLEGKSLTFPGTATPAVNPAAGGFSFGQSSTTGATSASFSFGSGKPFSFGNSIVAPSATEEKKDNEEKDDEDEPPKVEIKPITEEGAIYEKRCKVFFKKEKVYSDRGIGVLFLKPTPNGKTQLIVRAENSLGNLLINTLLTEAVRVQKMNKNTVMVVCLPLPDSQPPPIPVLLRVKTSEDADVLLENLEKNKK
uniref:RanBD1 domain-containing protein n=1 Tax=Bracon brevicornis TaxID=1563983 RepID=A0A6V7I4P9_9HYME